MTGMALAQCGTSLHRTTRGVAGGGGLFDQSSVQLDRAMVKFIASTILSRLESWLESSTKEQISTKGDRCMYRRYRI